MNGPTLVYVGDPMCSWCWGFAPVLERIVAAHGLPLEIVVGGLRPGAAAQPLTEGFLASLLHHWGRVAAATGQPFDRDALASRGPVWRYDTEPAAAAVVTMRSLRRDAELAFFTRLQRAFYAEGADLTDPAAYRPLLAEFAVDVDTFLAAMRSNDMRQAAQADFATARGLGVTGFPTTLMRIGLRHRMIAAGYQPFEHVDQVLHAVLDRHAPELSPGTACGGDGDAG